MVEGEWYYRGNDLPFWRLALLRRPRQQGQQVIRRRLLRLQARRHGYRGCSHPLVLDPRRAAGPSRPCPPHGDLSQPHGPAPSTPDANARHFQCAELERSGHRFVVFVQGYPCLLAGNLQHPDGPSDPIIKPTRCSRLYPGVRQRGRFEGMLLLLFTYRTSADRFLLG